MSYYFKQKTMRIRHAVVKLIAPNIWRHCFERKPYDEAETPRGSTKYAVEKGLTNISALEIGVDEGENALSIIRCLNPKILYLVDPYTLYREGGRIKDRRRSLKAMKKNLAPYRDRIVFIRKTSDEAIRDVPDNLDFIYIDGNHSYNRVLSDLKNYYPKVREDGIIAGHDFHQITVYRAVADFCMENGLNIVIWDFDFIIEKKQALATRPGG